MEAAVLAMGGRNHRLVGSDHSVDAEVALGLGVLAAAQDLLEAPPGGLGYALEHSPMAVVCCLSVLHQQVKKPSRDPALLHAHSRMGCEAERLAWGAWINVVHSHLLEEE
ncbi:MAG: hypothetical protein EOO23_08410 [Comamonadaceae bacterium]|nr:MAG: hypothetical protein EOO23_08410 [Comamonadaceae bacterium]